MTDAMCKPRIDSKFLDFKLTLSSCGLEDVFQLSGVSRDIGTCASHVNRYERTSSFPIVACFRIPNHTSGRSTQYSPKTREVIPGTQTSVRLHEQEFVAEGFDAAFKAGAKGFDVSFCHRSQVGIGDRRVGSGHKLDLWTWSAYIFGSCRKNIP